MLFIFNGFGPLSLAKSGPGVFLVRLGVPGSGVVLGKKCLRGNGRFMFPFVSGYMKNCVYQTKIRQ